MNRSEDSIGSEARSPGGEPGPPKSAAPEGRSRLPGPPPGGTGGSAPGAPEESPPRLEAPAWGEAPRSALPPLGQEHQIEREWIIATQLGMAIRVGVLALVTLVPLTVLLFAGGLSGIARIAAVAGWILLVVFLAIHALVWPPLTWRHAGYRLDERGLVLRWGVLFRSVTYVPLSRVQHVDVSEGPIERAFGLSTLVVHTAGMHQASVDVPGLARTASFAMRDYLVEHRGNDDAV